MTDELLIVDCPNLNPTESVKSHAVESHAVVITLYYVNAASHFTSEELIRQLM